MPHHTPLLALNAAGIGLALLLGLVANRLKLSPLVGYLLAGVVVGPFTPGFVADQARTPGVEALLGNGAEPDVLKATNIVNAQMLFVAIASLFEAGQIIAKARAANATLRIVARAHSDDEVVHLRAQGADEIVMGERELALSMLERSRREASTESPAA